MKLEQEDLQAYKQGKYGEPDPGNGVIFRSYESELNSLRCDDECILNMVIKDAELGTSEFSSDHRLEKVDPAWKEPREMIFTKGGHV